MNETSVRGLVEYGKHPKWTGGFHTSKKCGRCKHDKHGSRVCLETLRERATGDPHVTEVRACACRGQKRAGRFGGTE